MIFWVTSGKKYKRNVCDKEQHISSYLERHEIFKFPTGRVLFLLATQNFLMFKNKNTDNQTISCKYVYKNNTVYNIFTLQPFTALDQTIYQSTQCQTSKSYS